MSHRPQTSLVRIMEELGSTLLDVIAGEIDPDRSVEAIVIHDPLDEPDAPRGGIVLGVGIQEPAEAARILSRLGLTGTVGLVVRAPFAVDEEVRAAAESSGVVLLSLTRGTAWAHLAGMFRSLMTPGGPDDARPVTFGGILAGDLFAMANAIAALVEAPVTIEDRNSQMLAFSSTQEPRSPAASRGRQLPPHYTRLLEEAGVFQEITRSESPVVVSAPADDLAALEDQRTVMAVRAGDEVLGTIWVTSPAPLSEEHLRVLRDSARLVAMHMVWQRTDADVERRLRADLLRTALDGGPAAAEAVHRLGLREEPSVVLALSLHAPATDQLPHAALAAERKRIADAFSVHLLFAHPRSTVGLIGEVAYGVLPVSAAVDEAEESAVRLAKEFLTRVRSSQTPFIGIGSVVQETAQLPRSRSSADRALRVLRADVVDRQVARLEDVHAEALLLELSVPARDVPSGPLARLMDYDAAHQASLVDTLRAWLDAMGDVTLASQAMYVHQNTFRYRLRRVAEVGRIDLDDPSARFAVQLQLRLLAIAPDR
ncbi:PucR family transcriptional regulator [Microbacterium hydrocarbonoxydans]|uniref:PucR family transcriptional regulator n=1 Tax=Microbacterium hydrocarbonoxydans TaxID=273678 RepID=UPI0013D92260|nr:helix-turn-helix domain-containing protein [Microbacterium hydrocarbonoxydans]